MKQKKIENSVYEYLKKQLLERQLPAQSRVLEEKVAHDLSVSRSPVRGAFQRLIEEGYLKKEANRGVVVQPIPMTRKEYVDQLAVFELLLTHYFFQMEKVTPDLPWESLGKHLKELKQVLDLNQTDKGLLLSEVIFREFLVEQTNTYYQKILLDILNQIMLPGCKEAITTDFNPMSVFKQSFTKVYEYLLNENYPKARREIRIFVNSVMLNVVDKQELFGLKKYESD